MLLGLEYAPPQQLQQPEKWHLSEYTSMTEQIYKFMTHKPIAGLMELRLQPADNTSALLSLTTAFISSEA